MFTNSKRFFILLLAFVTFAKPTVSFAQVEIVPQEKAGATQSISEVTQPTSQATKSTSGALPASEASRENIDIPFYSDSSTPAVVQGVAPNQQKLSETQSSQKTFIISAYYSPLAGQNKYVTGSFAGDVRLNGEGVHSADGSLVYPGMIAAPKSYPFGMKMKIPGIGIVAVHDRGGAIVHAGERNQAYDRLDVWMGYGDTGLKRALNWGRRTVDVTIYGIDPNLKEQVYLEGYSEAEKYIQNVVDPQPELFNQDLSYGGQGEDVEKLQNTLKTLDYYNGDITRIYDTSTTEALIQFQIKGDIIDNAEDFGAGYLGPQTRQALASAMKNHNQEIQENLPQSGLGKDDRGDEVRKLQEGLKKLGYDLEVNGVYDAKTVEAIFRFQRENQIIKSEADSGAGFFGPKTFEVLASKLKGVAVVTRAQSQTIMTPVVFARDLKLGDKGDDVTRLQQELKRLNLLGVDPSGLYGEVTQHAVFKFQQSKGFIADENTSGAGVLGPLTRTHFNLLLSEREQTQKLIEDKLVADKRRDGIDEKVALNSR